MHEVLKTISGLVTRERLNAAKMAAWFNIKEEKDIRELLNALPKLPRSSEHITNEIVAELYETTFDNEIRMLLSSIWIHNPTVLINVVGMLHPDTTKDITEDMNNIYNTSRAMLCCYIPTVVYFILLREQCGRGTNISLGFMRYMIKPAVTKVTAHMRKHTNCGTTALVFPSGNVMYFTTRDECMMFINRRLYGIDPAELVLVTRETFVEEDVGAINKMKPLPIVAVVANFENDAEYRKIAKQYRRYMFALQSFIS